MSSRNQRQIEQMCSFILQEAREKAREIQIKVRTSPSAHGAI